jgi:hypothetical protein
MILTRPRVFAREVSRPVRISAEDARRFRWTTVRIVAALATLAGFVISALLIRETWRVGIAVPIGVYAIALVAPIIGGILLWAAFGMSTDMPTFIWRGIDSASPTDLAPLHHYACAPLILVPPWAIISIGGAWLFYAFGTDLELPVQIVVTSCTVVLLAMLWGIPAVMMQAATRCSWGRAALLMLYLPGHWVMMFFVALCVFGLAIAGLRALFDL